MSRQSLCDQAVALHRKGDLAGAEKLYVQILAEAPDSFAPLHLLGLIRYQQGQQAQAQSLIGAALKLEPGNAEAHSNYGLVLRALGKLEDALAHYDQALALKPGYADAHNNRGIALLDLGRLPQALDSYEAALAIRPNFAEAASNRGQVLQYLGRLNEARSAFAQSLTLAPKRAQIYLDYADVAPVPLNDPHVAAMETLLLTQGPSDTERVFLEFALAKAYDDWKEYPRSFRHLKAGNALKRTMIRYDEAGAMGFFDRIETIFTPALLREKEALGGGDPSDLPVFVMGMMRSGTTLVEQILASHPKIHGGGESPALFQTASAVRGKQDEIYPEYVAQLDMAALNWIGAGYLEKIRQLAPDARHITDKMPSNVCFAGLIHLALPRARMIHTIRDPVDNCLSCYSKLFLEEQNHTYDLGELGRYYRRQEKLMAHWRDVLPKGRILDVRYEDLIADLEGQARRIIAHCGLEWDARCLSFHTHARPIRTASVSQVRQPLYTSAVGRARAYDRFLEPLKRALDEPCPAG